ncbi:MAG: Dinitrogenase iron-molybdenum cofactor [Candidatus Methanofastidiosum methylothiophilum]|uniref:Dinitrogenase iron-molybdenum cofactor n=1 Tax=Candidatus Methanofastidiosum methylothiophilum TaxID=1705564 RepID=A0A150IXE5_9EURY|nr:MAG: Dinitrogenase iron-molybdenum cofactor [Candidatus Methanofastidiosum methylthiophilus]KYC47142.1 MAG: Dinitrogenase iron-molybdenum cofactor [Candidatus Methanofastidiosum methylthiophilus]KYC49558.1 MAG: Dinitrogenase iron-molybdenum cofactor [Candidatus Methanofastidiosum methylthiophilus]
MKVAVPTDSKGGLEGIVFNHFGMAPSYTIVEIIDNKISKVEVIENNSDHFGGSESPVDLLLKKNVGIVICSNLGPRAMEVLTCQGFDLFFTKREKVQGVIDKFIKGDLERFSGRKTSCSAQK